MGERIGKVKGEATDKLPEYFIAKEWRIIMYPIFNIAGIENHERNIEGNHAIIFLFVKPSDYEADSIIKQFNYLHHRSGKYCSIYSIGYSKSPSDDYPDIQEVTKVNGSKWYYSDQCFVEVCDQLGRRLKNWSYSGEPEMIILQNTSSMPRGTILDFRNYNYIDINYGIKKGYIDSFPRFMERIVNACKKEVVAKEVVNLANRKRLSGRKIFEFAMEMICVNENFIIENILNDKMFFKSYHDKYIA